MKYIEIKVKSGVDEFSIVILCDGVILTDEKCVEKATRWLKYAVSNT